MDGPRETATVPAYTQIRTSIRAGVGHIMLARPDCGNALNADMVREIGEAFEVLIAGGALLIALSGEGRHFCTGFDLSDLDDCSEGDLLLRFVRIEQMLQAVYQSPLPTLAIGKGRVVGAGADLFVACDRRIAGAGTSFNFPGAGFGLVLGTDRLRARIGRDNARRIVTQGETVDHHAAMAIGLATDHVPDVEIESWMAAIAERAAVIGSETIASLHKATEEGNGDAQLAALVRSSARPGLKARIRAYKAHVAARRSRPSP